MADRVIDLETRKKLTFRQAEGKEPLPRQLMYLEIDEEMRLSLWEVVYVFLAQYTHSNFRESIKLYGAGFNFSLNIMKSVLKQPIDDAINQSKNPENVSKNLKSLFLCGDPVVILEAIQVNLRDRDIPSDFKSSLIEILTDKRTTYGVIDNTIFPLASPEERNCVTNDLADIAASAYEAAYAHLRNASVEISAGQFKNSVRESIHAVESVLKFMTGKEDATLSDGLAHLQKTKPIHTTMKSAFEKLYAYTNSEHGIRHAMFDSENEKVGREEALFMFSACTAFVAFLVRKKLSEID